MFVCIDLIHSRCMNNLNLNTVIAELDSIHFFFIKHAVIFIQTHIWSSVTRFVWWMWFFYKCGKFCKMFFPYYKSFVKYWLALSPFYDFFFLNSRLSPYCLKYDYLLFLSQTLWTIYTGQVNLLLGCRNMIKNIKYTHIYHK